MWTKNDGFGVWKHVRVRALISENYTVPLKCETEGGRALKHALLCSETCPVPLMARDLMCKLNLKLTAGLGVIEEEQQMSCAKFEPQWAYEWHIRDSDWAQMILKLSVNQNMRKSGLAGQKMFLTRFDKIFWNENVCVLSACLSAKQMQLCLITEDSAPHLSTKATEQKCLWEKAWEPQKGWKGKRGENTLKYVDDLLICARDEVTCVADNVTLLNHLAREGHKVSLTKLQFCEAGNNLFWVTLTPNSKAISEKRIKAIKDVPRPLTKTIVIILGNVCILSNVYSKLCISWKALESPDNRERAEVMWQDGKAFLHRW